MSTESKIDDLLAGDFHVFEGFPKFISEVLQNCEETAEYINYLLWVLSSPDFRENVKSIDFCTKVDEYQKLIREKLAPRRRTL